MNKLIFAVAIACGCAQFAHAEQNQNWFTGRVQNSEPTADNGAWTAPADGWITTNATDFALMLDHTDTLDFTPSEGTAPDTNVMTRVVADLKFTAQKGDLPTFSSDAPKTAIMVKKDGTQLKYYAYANGSWVALDGDPSANAVTVLVEVDYRTSTPRARYGIISDAGAPTNFLNVAGTSDAWLTLTGTSPDLIEKVSFGGEGEVATIRGDVQLGVASYNSVKYPTVQEAVDEAGTTENAKVTVLRDNSETITIAEGQTIELDTNGKKCGRLVNESDTPVKVDIALDAATVAAGSGAYTNAEAVSGKMTINVSTTDTSKEAYGRVFKDGDTHYLEVVVRTSSNVLNNVKFDGKAVAPASNETYRAFLLQYCGDKNGAYMKANTTAAEITTQLGATGNNGLPLWESYVLDLKPNDATSKPAAVVKPAAEDAANMVLTVPTYKATLPESNYTVQYQRMKSADGQSWTEDGVPITDASTVAVPFNTSGSKYQYRVNTVIVPKTQD